MHGVRPGVGQGAVGGEVVKIFFDAGFTPIGVRVRKHAPDAVVAASVQMITSPLEPGMNAMISVKTNAEAKCTIKVVYDKTASTDSGLVEKIADDYGMVSWTWTVEPTAPLGSWPVWVTCANEKNSAAVKADLKLEKKAPEATPAN